jgi:hypothetical protein
MEYSISWGGDPEDICFTTSGVGSLVDADAMFTQAIADPRWRPGMKVLFDHTKTDWGAITSVDLTELPKLLKRLGPEFGSGRVAAAVPDPASFHTNRLMALEVDRGVPWLGHVFHSLEEARAWLREPHEELLPHVQPQW